MAASLNEIPALPKCVLGHDIPADATICIVCGEAVGFPNVRYSERKEEVSALGKRVAKAKVSATARGCLAQLEDFGRAVATSRAVVSRSQADLDAMLVGDGNLMQAYHPAIRAGLRVARNNEFDPARDLNDSRISPFFYDKLHFAALSLDRKGVPHYGPFAITLRDQMTAKRSTVFEENPVRFNERYPISRRKPLPYGYRATWGDRGKLAMAKLQPKIEPTTTESEYPDILLEKQPAPNGESDFIEVHIYGPLHPKAFEHVIANIPNDEFEKLLWERMKLRLDAFGISYDEVFA